MDIFPIGKWLLVHIVDNETTESGLVQVNQPSNVWGELIELGDVRTDSLEEGDKVFFSKFQSVEVDPQDPNLVVVKFDDIMACKFGEKAPSDDVKVQG